MLRPSPYRDATDVASSLSDLVSIYAGEVNSAAHLAVKSFSRRLAAINGTGSKDMSRHGRGSSGAQVALS
jgi:hypothetical protein